MKAGTLRHRIDVIEKSVTVDPNTGVQTEAWAYKYQSIPASFRTLTSREMQAAAQRQSSVTSEFEIRSGLDINPEDKVIFNDRVWDIEPPQDDPTLRIMQKIKAADISSIQDIEVSSG